MEFPRLRPPALRPSSFADKAQMASNTIDIQPAAKRGKKLRVDEAQCSVESQPGSRPAAKLPKIPIAIPR